MGICVEIEVSDDGKVTVGVDPEKEYGERKGYMQPAQSLEDALQTAKDLLTNGQAQAAQAGPDQAPAAPGGMDPQAAQAAAQQSFGAIRGGPR